MKTRIILFTLLTTGLLISGCSSTKVSTANRESNLRYDIECAGLEGKPGTFLVMTWVYSAKANISTDLIKEAAIRGIIFRGYQGEGCVSQTAMIGNPAVESEKADFFDTFFRTGGSYLNYATALENSFEVVKLSKKEYKTGMAVSVSKDALRKALEDAGILKKLSDGF